jgi:hypothetical protein
MNINPQPGTLGAVIALAAGILALVFAAIGHLPWIIAGLIIALAVARLT